jgi:preprotein translocase subunit YajC
LKNRLSKLGLLTGTTGVLLFTAACAATTPGSEPSSGGFDYTTILLLVVMVVGFYFLMIRPQQKRQKAQRQLLEDLKKGDKVITTGGVFGTIEAVDDETIIIKVESGATLRVLKNSVMVKRES